MCMLARPTVCTLKATRYYCAHAHLANHARAHKVTRLHASKVIRCPVCTLVPPTRSERAPSITWLSGSVRPPNTQCPPVLAIRRTVPAHARPAAPITSIPPLDCSLTHLSDTSGSWMAQMENLMVV